MLRQNTRVKNNDEYFIWKKKQNIKPANIKLHIWINEVITPAK